MNTGRQLDSWIAVYVMGWRTEHVPPLFKDDVWITRLYRDNEEITYLSGLRTITDLIFAVPRYSTDITNAWQVISSLGKRGIWLDSLEQKWEESTRVIFGWRDPDRGLLFAQEMANTAPLAICLAAKKAIETKKG